MRPKDIMVAALAVGAAAVGLYFATGERPQKVNLDIYSVIGAVTAEETVKLLGGKGQVVIVIRDLGPAKDPSIEAQLESFRQTLKKHAGMSAAVEKIQIPPMQMMALGGVPPAQLLRIVRDRANLSAVVSFLGFPQAGDSELDGLKKTGVKMVVISSLRPGYRRLLERQNIHLAIVPRAEPQPVSGSAPRTIRERFDLEYLVLTPADASRLP